VNHSYRNDSIGSSRAARAAGQIPKNNPTDSATADASTTQNIDTCEGSVHRQADAPEEDADHAPDRRQHHRLQQKLHQDVSLACAHRFAHADFPRAL
jgi:hypothetical protein